MAQVANSMNGLITLTTDFGLADEYVGVMKGVILGLAPTARIVDLSHGVTPQNVAQAAFLIASGSRYFPAHTIHVVVVDPGVGSERRLILVGARKQLFLAPDNGVLSLLLADNEFDFAHVVSNHELFLSPLSQTFHGRDILAPVAAHLASGTAITAVGERIERAGLVQLDLTATLAADGNSVRGRVIHVDRFGNLITNIDRRLAEQVRSGINNGRMAIYIKGRRIDHLVRCYDETPSGTLLALIGSRGFLEIAINQGDAMKFLGVSPGEIVELKN